MQDRVLIHSRASLLSLQDIVCEYPTLVAYADRIRRTWFADQLDNTKQIWQVEGTSKAAAGAGKAEALLKPE